MERVSRPQSIVILDDDVERRLYVKPEADVYIDYCDTRIAELEAKNAGLRKAMRGAILVCTDIAGDLRNDTLFRHHAALIADRIRALTTEAPNAVTEAALLEAETANDTQMFESNEALMADLTDDTTSQPMRGEV
jgi:hypothetical protein